MLFPSMKLNIHFKPNKNMKVKIKSYLKNNKADNAMKQSNLLAAHGHTVRYLGKTYFIRAVEVGGSPVVSAEAMQGKEPIINLFTDKTDIASDLKKLCENRLYS